MASPSELSIEEIRSFIQSRGGKVTNYELVKHFKRFLTDPQQKETARETFKKYVNILGSIKNENGEKYIVLKKKKISEPAANKADDSLTFSPSSSFQEVAEQREPPPYIPPPSVLQPIQNIQSPTVVPLQDAVKTDNQRKTSVPQSTTEPENDEVVYRHSVKQQLNKHPHSYTQDYVSKPSEFGIQHQDAQQSDVGYQMINITDKPSSVAIRKQSLESSILSGSPQNKKPFHHSISTPDIGIPQNKADNITPNKQNKSLEDVLPLLEDMSMKKTHSTPEIAPVGIVTKQKKRLERAPIQDEPDSTTNSQEIIPSNRESCRSLNLDCEPVSVRERMERFNKFAVDGEHNRRSSLKKSKIDYENMIIPGVRPINRSFFMLASSGNFNGVISLLNQDPELINATDVITNILHWGAKYNCPDIIKVVCMRAPGLINRQSSGGYTPLHVANIFNNHEICHMLVHVYGANPEIRDFSGRKPNFYGTTRVVIVPGSTAVSSTNRTRKQPDQKFLRMGSLNMRVKKTTNAVSNFLGVGTGHKLKNSQRSHVGALTSWGSADNIQEDGEKMPPPQSTIVKRSKRNPESLPSTSRSTPCTPSQPRSAITNEKDISPSPSTSTLHDSDSDTACGFDANWQDKKA